ncbi:hypothetical protein [Paenibacillus sp. FSL H7-0714]|uniref:hypothetical protein n=1 Tax=Paenibacillus sp. FSL H7-0714 TaxID=2954735 RepID=UPI0030F8B7B5
MIIPEQYDVKGRIRWFTIRGLKGSIQLSVTYTEDPNGEREYQVDKINTGAGWTKKCPKMPDILMRHIGENYIGTLNGTRLKWLKWVYHSNESKQTSAPLVPALNKPKDLLQGTTFSLKVEIGDRVDVVAAFGGSFHFEAKTHGLQSRQCFSMPDYKLSGNLWLGLGPTGTRAAKENGITYSIQSPKYNHFILNITGRTIDGKTTSLSTPPIEFQCNDQKEFNFDILGHMIKNDVLQFSGSKTSKHVARDIELLGWDEELDGQSTHTYRKDQVKLRQSLLAGRTHAPCVICGETFPNEFLWAAHLKKRTACKDEEKRDHENIARLMCKFGCDDLYEKGFLSVVEGEIRLLKKSGSAIVDKKLQLLEGRICTAWNPKTSSYFTWHYDYFRDL